MVEDVPVGLVFDARDFIGYLALFDFLRAVVDGRLWIGSLKSRVNRGGNLVSFYRLLFLGRSAHAARA